MRTPNNKDQQVSLADHSKIESSKKREENSWPSRGKYGQNMKNVIKIGSGGNLAENRKIESGRKPAENASKTQSIPRKTFEKNSMSPNRFLADCIFHFRFVGATFCLIIFAFAYRHTRMSLLVQMYVHMRKHVLRPTCVYAAFASKVVATNMVA